jgi:hypothetical protein
VRREVKDEEKPEKNKYFAWETAGGDGGGVTAGIQCCLTASNRKQGAGDGLPFLFERAYVFLPGWRFVFDSRDEGFG